MFLAGKRLSRRTVLRGMGAAVALPLLDSMVPARANAPAPNRLVCIEMVHGAAGSSIEPGSRHYWSPARDGRDFEFSYTLEPLAPFRDCLTVVSGTDAGQAEAFEPTEVGADHFRSSAVFLTATHPKQTAGADVVNGTSIDQIYAQRVGRETPIPSIQLGIEYLAPTNSCAFTYNCIYSDAISWASPTAPLLPEVNPRVVFEKLFRGRNVVDGVSPDAARLRRRLGPADAARVDLHLEEVRAIERRIEAVERHNAIAQHRELFAAPLGLPDSWEQHVKLMFDLQVLAFAMDVTRVSSFKMSHDVSNRIFPESGVRTPFHSLSHHNETPGVIAEFAKLNRYHVSLIPYFLDRLRKTPDGDGTLLDHALVLYGSPMGDSSTHNHKRVPLFLAGHAGGALKGNLHVTCPEGTPQANALLTVLHKLGVDIGRVGDSTGTIAMG